MESTGIQGMIQTTGHMAELAWLSLQRMTYNFGRQHMVHVKGKEGDGDKFSNLIVRRSRTSQFGWSLSVAFHKCQFKASSRVLCFSA
jgi:hypothetical protein